jgi:hypothetical protein
MELCSYCKKNPVTHPAFGWCGACYQRYRAHGSPERVKVRNTSKCKVEGCEKTQVTIGLCATHYARQLRHAGDLNAGRPDDWGKRRSHPYYRIWDNIKQRCLNPEDKAYFKYGGRGIGVCDRWLENFWAFVEDMGDRPSPQHSVDRRNNAGDYTPDNCRWATKAEQAQNSRINVVNAHTVPEMRRRHANGESIRAVATAFGLGYHTAYAILKERTWKP